MLRSQSGDGIFTITAVTNCDRRLVAEGLERGADFPRVLRDISCNHWERVDQLNLPEWERFKTNVHDAVTGKADLAKMLRDRLRSEKYRPPKVKVETRVEFDDTCSAHSTLVEVIAQDQPGLLYRIGSQFSQQDCNIEIALIETEGQTAIDVFYLTSNGAKLGAKRQAQLRAALLADLVS